MLFLDHRRPIKPHTQLSLSTDCPSFAIAASQYNLSSQHLPSVEMVRYTQKLETLTMYFRRASQSVTSRPIHFSTSFSLYHALTRLLVFSCFPYFVIISLLSTVHRSWPSFIPQPNPRSDPPRINHLPKPLNPAFLCYFLITPHRDPDAMPDHLLTLLTLGVKAFASSSNVWVIGSSTLR